MSFIPHNHLVFQILLVTLLEVSTGTNRKSNSRGAQPHHKETLNWNISNFQTDSGLSTEGLFFENTLEIRSSILSDFGEIGPLYNKTLPCLTEPMVTTDTGEKGKGREKRDM